MDQEQAEAIVKIARPNLERVTRATARRRIALALEITEAEATRLYDAARKIRNTRLGLEQAAAAREGRRRATERRDREMLATFERAGFGEAGYDAVATVTHRARATIGDRVNKAAVRVGTTAAHAEWKRALAEESRGRARAAAMRIGLASALRVTAAYQAGGWDGVIESEGYEPGNVNAARVRVRWARKRLERYAQEGV